MTDAEILKLLNALAQDYAEVVGRPYHYKAAVLEAQLRRLARAQAPVAHSHPFVSKAQADEAAGRDFQLRTEDGAL